MHNGDSVDIIADGGAVIDNSKYSTSKNSLTGLYYRLHILNVGVSDVKKYRCEGNVNGRIKFFYLQLYLLGRRNYALVIFKVGTSFLLVVSSENSVLKFDFQSCVKCLWFLATPHYQTHRSSVPEAELNMISLKLTS